MNNFLGGAVAMAAAVCALHFFKAYRQTRERLFKLFALAFFLFVIERIALQATGTTGDKMPVIYCLRLLSFLAIAAGVVEKNLQKS
jgi:hypothetical protein